MASASSSSSRGSSPNIPPIVQPDHFYGSENAPITPRSDGRMWLDPDDDPSASRGIPVFKPTMDEFVDFEGYMKRVECWGMKSGIVKIVPPKEWKDALDPINNKLADVKLNHPIEQHMVGRAGLFRQKNVEAYKRLSVREWAELCEKDEYRAPGVDEVGPRSSRAPKRAPQRKQPTVEPVSPTLSTSRLASEAPASPGPPEKVKVKGKRKSRTHADKLAKLEVRAALDKAFFDSFDPHTLWLPHATTPSDYTPDFCSELERQYWRNLGFGRPAQYGADMAGSLFSSPSTPWNIACLPSTLERLMPRAKYPTQGVNMPYLYFGMWRATFAWHVEDCDLFSINYIHFGAPKHWYAVPQARADAFEGVMRGFFSEGQGPKACPQFLRHKAFLVSPTILAKSSCRPNTLVQHSGEFVVTYPRGYHAGFNLGFNCAESANFALDSWLERGRNAEVCECVDDAVRIDVDELVRAREEERVEEERRREEKVVVVAPTPAPAPAPVPVQPPMAQLDQPIFAIDPALLMNSIAPSQPKPSQPLTFTLPPASSTTNSTTNPTSKSKPARKRKSDEGATGSSPSKKSKTSSSSSSKSSKTATGGAAWAASSSISTIKLPARPSASSSAAPADDSFPCCLCASMSTADLLPVHARAVGYHGAWAGTRVSGERWMAHEGCAMVIPETYVDTLVESGEKMVFGVDAIVKDRWNLRCMACKSTRPKTHGAPIQCTKGRCSKAYHVTCARLSPELHFSLLYQNDQEVPIPGAAPICVGEGYPAVVPVKKVRKWEVNVFCAQHNPEAIRVRMERKEEELRKTMLGLAPGSRIKVRVHSGVFEVSLVGIDEEARLVDVIWDHAIQRSFKWGSVVFDESSTSGVPIPQSQPPPQPPQPQSQTQSQTQSQQGAGPSSQTPPGSSSTPADANPYSHHMQYLLAAQQHTSQPQSASPSDSTSTSNARTPPIPYAPPIQRTAYQPRPYIPPPPPPAPLPMSAHMADWLARQKLAAAGLPVNGDGELVGRQVQQQEYRVGALVSGSWTYGQVAAGSGGGGAASSGVGGPGGGDGGGGGVASGMVIAEPPAVQVAEYALDPALLGESGSSSDVVSGCGSGSGGS